MKLLEKVGKLFRHLATSAISRIPPSRKIPLLTNSFSQITPSGKFSCKLRSLRKPPPRDDVILRPSEHAWGSSRGGSIPQVSYLTKTFSLGGSTHSRANWDPPYLPYKVDRLEEDMLFAIHDVTLFANELVCFNKRTHNVI